MKYIAIICILVNLISCNNKNEEIIYLNTNELITDEGNYCIEKKNLNVRIVDNKVEYILMDSLGNILVKNETPSISNLHNWGILLDDEEQLWIESSDVGLYVAIKDSSGKYKFKEFNYIPRKKDVPEKIYNIFPSTIKKE